MKSIKIVQKFFTEKEAKKAISYQRAQAKKEGMLIDKIDMIDAKKFFKSNSWEKKSPFVKLGLPQYFDFMVIVYYKVGASTPQKEKLVKKRVIRAKKNKNAAEKFFIVRLTQHQKRSFTPAAFKLVSNSTFPIVRFRQVTHEKAIAAKVIALDLSMSLAA